jgi:hypothetical protein
MMRAARSALLIVLCASAAAAQSVGARVVPLGRRPGAVQARVGEEVTLAVTLLDARGRSAALPAGSVVRWLQVEPRREHVERPSPNPGLTSFSNAVLFGPRHGQWLGYDTLEYTQSAAATRSDMRVEGALLHVRAAHPTDASEDTHGGAGSVWFAAEVTLPDGRIARTPDARSTDRLGLLPVVQRVSFRADDTFLGWLGTYFHVTSVFASSGPSDAGHQGDRYTGADCADVLIAALRASGNRALHYTSVAGIDEYARPLTGVLSVDASALRDRRGAAVHLRWGAEVLPGDLVTIDYSAEGAGRALPRAWDHIGALVRDANGDGVLDAGDVLRHMGGHGLVDTPMMHGGPMRIVLWRWRAQCLRGARGA